MHACMHVCMYELYCIVVYCNAMQWNGMEWNGMYACMYTVHIPISSHIALVFFPSVGFGPILFQLNSRGPGPGSK